MSSEKKGIIYFTSSSLSSVILNICQVLVNNSYHYLLQENWFIGKHVLDIRVPYDWCGI